MTGQAKQTEPRCEVIPGAGQRQMRTQEDRWKGCRDGEKEKGGETKQVQRGGKRVKDGREGEEKRNTPQRRCAHYSVLDESPAISPHRS